MTIIFRKKEGKPHAMQCIRNGALSDQTWQRSNDFYVFHDLLHYAVETTLSLEKGFFGLLKQGVSIHDFAGPREQRPKLGQDAMVAEALAGAFQQEFAPGQTPADNFNEAWHHQLRLMGASEFPMLSEAQVEAMRAAIRHLLQRWRDTPVGGSLTLEF